MHDASSRKLDVYGRIKSEPAPTSSLLQHILLAPPGFAALDTSSGGKTLLFAVLL